MNDSEQIRNDINDKGESNEVIIDNEGYEIDLEDDGTDEDTDDEGIDDEDTDDEGIEDDYQTDVDDELETSLIQNEEVLENLVFELNDMLTNIVVSNAEDANETYSDSDKSLDEWLHQFSPTELTDFIEMIYCKIDDYIQSNVRQMYTESFHEDLLHYLIDEVDDILMESDMDTVSNEEIAYVCEQYSYQYFDQEIHKPLVPCRSLPSNQKSWYNGTSNNETYNNETCNNDSNHGCNDSNDKLVTIDNTLNWLQSIHTPDQRTNEWYQFRANLITASNIWQVFISESSRNRLIYEKCNITTSEDGTISTQVYTNNNTNSPMHWGIKYEPLTVMIYEKINNTTIGQFGCIPHETYSCIGASPDGINIDKTSPLYGRMLEIKNIFNRDITGIPKDAYWIQMQVQMETCKLNECDFVESRFKEYESADAFYEDIVKRPDIEKGVVLMLTHLETNQIQYRFMPLTVELTKAAIDEWISEQETQVSKEYTIQQIQYWYLDEWSCVLVLRNEYWFQSVVHEIVETWDIILRERVTGFSHRTPKKRSKLHDDLLNTMNTSMSKDIKVIQLGK